MAAQFNDTLIVSPVAWTLVTSERQFHKLLKEMAVPKENWPAFYGSAHANATCHFFEQDGKMRAVVTMRHSMKHSYEQQCALLAHEAMHIWREIRENIGEKAPSTEFEAYALQSILQDLLVLFRDSIKKKGKKRG